MVTYVKQAPWIELKKELFADYPLCQYCLKEEAWELAHAIFHKRYKPGTKNRKYTDVRENAVPTCKSCGQHSETREGRLLAWSILKEREGEAHMRGWYDNFPAKIKEVMP